MNDEFDMMWSDWISTDIEMKKTYVAKELLRCVEVKYPNTGNAEINDIFDRFYDKALTLNQKLSMMLYAQFNIKKVKQEFEITQNMEFPMLYGIANTELLFYFESMIVFARNALDVAATIYCDLIFDKRCDSFNSFSKSIIKSDDPLLVDIKDYFVSNGEDVISAYRLLCGSEKGRALRDIIIHQANVKLEYCEYKENSEKEHLFLMIKDSEPIDFDWFVSNFADEVVEILEKTNSCCEKYVKNKYVKNK